MAQISFGDNVRVRLTPETETLGLAGGFLPALSPRAAYLYPGAPLLRGADNIRAFLESADSGDTVTWSPTFADVSADGRLGYSYGFLHSSGRYRAKYLACWVKDQHGWSIVAYARSRMAPGRLPAAQGMLPTDCVMAPTMRVPGIQ